MTVISLPQPIPSLIVFGRDQSGKPHASWFDQASAELATKAAGLMNMRAVPVGDSELRELAVTLPRGRVFSSGKAFTPFIKGKLYERLVELTRDFLGMSADETGEDRQPADQGSAVSDSEAAEGTTAQDSGAASAAAAPKAGKPADERMATQTKGKPRPTKASDVGMGSLVLAEDRGNEGWFEAEVIGINGGMLTLRWRDYNEPTITRRANELGFLPTLVG